MAEKNHMDRLPILPFYVNPLTNNAFSQQSHLPQDFMMSARAKTLDNFSGNPERIEPIGKPIAKSNKSMTEHIAVSGLKEDAL